MFSRPPRERDRDGQAGEDQRRREEQRVADAVGPREGAAKQEAIRLDGAVADERDDQRAGEKRAQDGHRRKEQVAKNLHARPLVSAELRRRSPPFATASSSCTTGESPAKVDPSRATHEETPRPADDGGRA